MRNVAGRAMLGDPTVYLFSPHLQFSDNEIICKHYELFRDSWHLQECHINRYSQLKMNKPELRNKPENGNKKKIIINHIIIEILEN